MKALATSLPDVILLELKRYSDARGTFMETFREGVYREAGVSGPFVQDNLSHSRKHVLRGLHFQKHQGKLVTVVSGEIFDVAVDIRPDSSHFGRWTGAILSSENHRQLYIPSGFAHGFCVLSEEAAVWYKTSRTYRPEEEGGLAWDDPTVSVDWPLATPILSERDQNHPRLEAIDRSLLVSG